MRVITWNVNSIRSRLERTLELIDRHAPDVLCLQETKVVDEEFPTEAFTKRGYQVSTSGQKTYNGVAILSKREQQDVVRGIPDGVADDERRVIAATIDGVRIVDLYVPNGSAVGSDKYEYKLAWLARLKRWLAATMDAATPWLVCGDFNIAPDDRDVWDPEVWRGQVLFSEPEHAALRELFGLGLIDSFRRFEEGDGQYSWWDYRQLAFQKRRGVRIDLMLANEALLARIRSVVIDKDERRGKSPSDHAPVIADWD